jgi:predicted nucleotidyltransferase
MDDRLLARLRGLADRLLRDRGIVAAYVFGSRVSGRPRPDSDLDIGYYLERRRRRESLPIREEMLLAADLAAEMGCDVDLRSLGDAPLELRGKVLEEGARIFSGDDVERVALERETLARYHDYKDTFARMHQVRLKALRLGARR